MKLPRLGGHRLTLLAVAALAIALLLLHNQLPSFNLQRELEKVSGSLGAWTYLLVGALAFFETGAFVGLVAPGEFTLILGGAVAGQGDISLPLIIAIAWFCAWGGDTASFFIGQRLGRGFLIKYGPRLGIDERRLDQVDSYFERHGGKTILIGRFIGLVRALAPFIAGSSKMRYREFVPYSVLGTGLWASGLLLVGYFASRSIDKVAALVGRGFLLFGITVGVVVALVLVARFVRDPENRRRLVEAMERRALLRPPLALGRRFRPHAEFAWRRLIPGEGVGLELTSLLAVFAVGLFVLVAYASIVSSDPGPTPGDRAAIDLVDDLRTGWIVDLAKALTALGSAWAVLPLATIAAIALAMRSRWAELCVLVAGIGLTTEVGHILKAAIDRPRPAGGLVGASGSSFPSLHAADSIFYAWLAVTLALRWRPGLTPRTVVISTGVALAALIGLTRLYLGVHYLSDVAAGWGLGAAAFSGAAAVALVLVYIRQYVRRDGGPEPRPSGGEHLDQH